MVQHLVFGNGLVIANHHIISIRSNPVTVNQNLEFQSEIVSKNQNQFCILYGRQIIYIICTGLLNGQDCKELQVDCSKNHENMQLLIGVLLFKMSKKVALKLRILQIGLLILDHCACSTKNHRPRLPIRKIDLKIRSQPRIFLER